MRRSRSSLFKSYSKRILILCEGETEVKNASSPLEAFWHFIFLDFRNGKLSDLSFEFEFLFYRRTETTGNELSVSSKCCLHCTNCTIFYSVYLDVNKH